MTARDHMGHESWLERDRLILLDRDPQVRAMSSQPFWLHWHDGGRQRRHAPDYFVRLTAGQARVVDVALRRTRISGRGRPSRRPNGPARRGLGVRVGRPSGSGAHGQRPVARGIAGHALVGRWRWPSVSGRPVTASTVARLRRPI
ncbi:hypothetical protein [Streptomyces sp. NPDC051219]|uniref:hypothetical protein n=1 Tax=Streptomyces sp. NPDC051219 TaxID=3155283 RepID=UPI0034458610